MTAISREMLIGLKMPRDFIEEVDGKIHAEIDHFEIRNGLLTPIRTKFIRQIGKTLAPFQYLKPDISQGDLLSPVTQWEDTLRKGYQVIGRINDSARMANHIDAIRNALIMALEVDGEWQTRYFPEGNIKEETWNEGNALLDQ